MQTLEAWRRWRTWLEATKSTDTVRSYAGNVHRFIAETGSRDRISEYTEEDCTWFFSDKGVVRGGRAKYEYAKALNSFFRWCVRRDLLEANPMEDVPVRKPRRVRPVALTEDELARVIYAAATLQGERVAWALLLIYLLALRRIEAAGLRWSDLSEGTTGPVIAIRQTKGRDEREPQPLSPLAMQCLVALSELPAPPQVRVGPEYVLRVRRSTVTKWMHQAGLAAGLEGRKLHAHRLRTSMATHMLQAGVDVRAVRDALGHLELASTDWYAAAATEREVRHGLELIAGRLAG